MLSFFKRKLIVILFTLLKDDTPPVLSQLDDEKKQGFWLSLWENPVFRLYLHQRDEWLKDEAVRAIMNGDKGNAWMFTGQRKEIQEFAQQAKIALERKHASLEKARKQNVS